MKKSLTLGFTIFLTSCTGITQFGKEQEIYTPKMIKKCEENRPNDRYCNQYVDQFMYLTIQDGFLESSLNKAEENCRKTISDKEQQNLCIQTKRAEVWEKIVNSIGKNNK